MKVLPLILALALVSVLPVSAAQAQWRSQGMITPEGGIPTLEADIEDGYLLTMWLAPGTRVLSRDRPAGGPFAEPRVVTEGPSSAFDLDVASNGRALIAWMEADGRVMTQTRGPDGAFGPAEVAAEGRDPASHLVAAIAPNGEAVVAWRTDGASIRVAFRPAGADRFAGPFEVATGNLGRPVLSLDDQGNAILAYVDNAVRGVAVHRRAGGGPGGFGPRELMKRTGLDISHQEFGPALAIGGDGTAVIAFTEGRPGVSVARLHASGATGTTTDGFRPHATLSGPFARDLTAAVGPSGRKAVTWRANSGRFSKVQAATAAPGSGTFVFATLSGRNARQPRLVVTGDRVTVAWERRTAQGRRVEAGSRRGGERWLPAEVVSGYGLSSGTLSMAGSTSGEQWVSWARDRAGAESARASTRDGRFGRVVRVPSTPVVDTTQLFPGAGSAMLLVLRELSTIGLGWSLYGYGEGGPPQSRPPRSPR